MSKWKFAVMMAVVAGCGGGSEPQGQSPLLGIARIDVREDARTLEISGLDAGGARIAHVSLRLGPGVLTDDGREVDGRQMTIEVLGAEVSHHSEGFAELQLPLFGNRSHADLNEFLLDPRVQPILARWQITFQDPPRVLDDADAPLPTEVAQSGCTYAPTSSCGATSCAESVWPSDWGNGCSNMRYQWVCCGGNGFAAQRACTSPSSSSPCGTTGPGGCASCWTFLHGGSCFAYTAGAFGQHTCGSTVFFPDDIRLVSHGDEYMLE
jgi:hypothetical protein